MLFAQLHRCSTKTVLREHRADRCAGLQGDHSQVFAVGFAHTGFGDTNVDACYGMQILRACYV
jgi:hypothetical protein